MNKRQIIFLILFLATIAIVGILAMPRDRVKRAEVYLGTIKDEKSTAIGTEANAFLTNENYIYIEDQVSGNEIKVREVLLKEDGYISIRLVGREGDKIDHASGLISAGRHFDYKINLSEKIVAGDYEATLFLDNGDGLFDYLDDRVATDKNGVILYSHFTVVE